MIIYKCAYCGGMVDYIDSKCPHCYADKPNWRIEINTYNDNNAEMVESTSETESTGGYEGTDLNIGSMVSKIVFGMILILVFSALWKPISSSLAQIISSDPNIGPIIQTVFPILIIVGILLIFVMIFLPKRSY